MISTKGNYDFLLNAYMREMRAYNAELLSAKEEQDLARQIFKGDQRAREKMILSNRRLVVSIAKKYQNQGLSLMDIISEGNLGLIKSVDGFRAGHNGKKNPPRFCTYAYRAIERSIKRALTCSRAVRGRFNDPLSKRPLVESLDASDSDGEEPYSHEVIDLGAEDPSENAAKNQRYATLYSMLDKLNEYERGVLACRFGLLDGGNEQTLEDVGKRYNVTRERIRQVQAKAIRKLRKRMTGSRSF